MPPTIVASSIWTHAGSRGRPAGQLGHRERHAAGDGGDLLDQLLVGLGDVATDQTGHRALVEGSQLGHHRALARHEALAHLQERRTDGVEPVGHHQGHTLVRRGPGEVVEEAQAGLVGIVDVVDGEQQPLPRRRQPDELGGGHEEPLVAPIPAPGHLPTRQRPVDLDPVGVVEAVEEGDVAAADVGQRLEHRRIGPRALHRGRRALPDPEALLGRQLAGSGQQRRLPDAGRARHEQRPAATRGRLGQRPTERGLLRVAPDQLLVGPRARARRPAPGRGARSPQDQVARRARGSARGPCARTGGARRGGRRRRGAAA